MWQDGSWGDNSWIQKQEEFTLTREKFIFKPPSTMLSPSPLQFSCSRLQSSSGEKVTNVNSYINVMWYVYDSEDWVGEIWRERQWTTNDEGRARWKQEDQKVAKKIAHEAGKVVNSSTLQVKSLITIVKHQYHAWPHPICLQIFFSSDYKQTTPNYVVLYQRIVWRQWYQDLQECEKYSEENAVQCVQ